MSVFHPNEHMMQLKKGQGTTDYLEVKWRLVWFREQCPQGTIDTEEMEIDLDREITVEVSVWNNEKRRSEKVMKTAKGYARYKAVVTDGKGGRATGHGSESAVDFGDYIEKAETKAVGRALAMLGYGTQFTGDELAEHHRIVDSPVENMSYNAAKSSQNEATVTQTNRATNGTPARENVTTTSQPDAQSSARTQLNALFVRGKDKGLFANSREMAEQFVSEVLEHPVTKDDLYKLNSDELFRVELAIAGTTEMNGAA